jgi:very-short-patch-repair endonuclease
MLFRKTHCDFIIDATLKHGDMYDYSNVKYVNSSTKVEIICKIHGSFLQRPTNHLVGNGCPKCGGRIQSNTTEFVSKAKAIHLDKYIYDKVLYVTARKKVIIGCARHGDFLQTPCDHLSGYGCPRCAHKVSKWENEFLDSLNKPNLKRQHHISVGSKRFLVDGYDEENKMVYECNGDYYHGNIFEFDEKEMNTKVKKTYGELYRLTHEKKEILESAGYKVMSIWESDWKELNKKNNLTKEQIEKNKRFWIKHKYEQYWLNFGPIDMIDSYGVE